MNKLDLMKEVRKNYHNYHIPGQSHIHTLKRNAIFINRANSLEHEQGKLEVAYCLQYFLTEAAENKTNKRVDVVDLVTNTQYEIVFKHESDLEIKEYRRNGVIVFIVGPKYQCKICQRHYPKRNKKGVCKNCEA